jgi:hypothetical protein
MQKIFSHSQQLLLEVISGREKMKMQISRSLAGFKCSIIENLLSGRSLVFR